MKEAFAHAPSDRVIYHTLEIRQTGVQDSKYIVKNRRAITARDEDGDEIVFQPCNFDFTLPSANEEGVQSLNITIDNMNREASDFVEVAADSDVSVEVIYRPYLSIDLSTPQMDPPLVMFLEDIQITETEVTGRGTFMDIVNKKFPSIIYTRAQFPSLG